MLKYVDVSEHNKTIDWEKVKRSGVSGAIIRAGYGRGNVDKYAIKNIKGAKAAGLPVQIYYFSYAYTQAMARAEAEYCVNIIKPYITDTTIYFDFEYDSAKYARRHSVKVNKNFVTQLTLQFCERVKQLGYTPGVYYNLDYRKNYYDLSKISSYVQWLADYAPPMSYSADVWQYSSKGRVNGISGYTDVNYVITNTGKGSDVAKSIKEKIKMNIEVPHLSEGDSGVWVGVVQWAVHTTVDFDFGAKTVTAVKAFQKEYGLAEDGNVGEKTWSEIFKKLS